MFLFNKIVRGKMEEKEFPELFLCTICQRYQSINELVEVRVREYLFPKNICNTCFKKVGGGSAEVPKENTET